MVHPQVPVVLAKDPTDMHLSCVDVRGGGGWVSEKMFSREQYEQLRSLLRPAADWLDPAVVAVDRAGGGRSSTSWPPRGASEA